MKHKKSEIAINLHHHHHSSFTEEYVVQPNNAIACLKFFSARFL
jgi:hypothetical protein